MSDAGLDTPEREFGLVEPASPGQLPLEEDFLAWGDDSNAAAIVLCYAEENLGWPTAGDPEVARVGFDLTLLGSSLARAWRKLRSESKGGSGQGVSFLDQFDFYSDLKRRDADRELWRRAREAEARGGVHLQRREPRQAVAAYTEALGLFESIGDVKGTGRCRGNLGFTYLHTGNPGPAVEECTEALKAHQSVGYQKGQLMHLQTLAQALMELKQWQLALETLERQERLGRTVDPTLRGVTQARLTVCHVHAGHGDEARECFEAALGALTDVHTPARAREVGAELSMPAALLGEPDPSNVISRRERKLADELRKLDLSCPAMAVPIVRRFQKAQGEGDRAGMHRALAQCPRWAVVAWEWLLATSALHESAGQTETAPFYLELAEQVAFRLSGAALVRGPLDATKLYKTWSLEKKVANARAFHFRMGARQVRGAEASSKLIEVSLHVYRFVGGRGAFGAWPDEWRRELSFPGQDHARLWRYVEVAKERSQGDFEGALVDLENALEIAQSRGSGLSVADVLLRIAILHHEARRMEQAAHWFARAEKAFATLESVGPLLRIEDGRCDDKLKMGVNLGAFLFDAGRYREAVAILDRYILEIDWFLEVPGTDGDSEYVSRAREFRTRALNTLSLSRASLGSLEAAEQTAHEALAWADEIDDPEARAVAHQSLAHAYLEQGRFQAAIRSAEADLDIQRQLGNPKDIAVALNSLADIHLRGGELESARRCGTEALELVGDSDPGLRSLILAGLAGVEERVGNADEAQRRYRESLRIHEGLDNASGLVSTETALALLLLNEGRRDEAEDLARGAWQRSASVQSLPARVAAGHVLALCKMEADSVEQWTDAANLLQEVCRLIEAMRREIRNESLKALQSMRRCSPYDLLVECLSTLADAGGDPNLRRRVFATIEKAKARSLIELISLDAERDARESGFQIAGLTVYPRSEREELPHTGFKEIHDMLTEEASS